MENEYVNELPSKDSFDEYNLVQSLEVEFEDEGEGWYCASPVGITTLVVGHGMSSEEARNDLLENLLEELDSYDVPGQVLAGKAEAERDSLRKYFKKVT